MLRSVLLLAALTLGLSSLLNAADPAAQPEITIFAAASTTDVLNAAAQAYGTAHHVTVTCSFGSSSTLAKQIAQGAPADLFLSADSAWMDHLAKQQGIVPASRVDLLANRLVLIAPSALAGQQAGQQSTHPLAITVEPGFAIAAAFSGRLAIGDPLHVPAGMYAKDAFTALGWWDQVKDRLAPAADVRAALKLVELGECDLGVVYATDAAAAAARVTVVATIPERLHQPIRYPLALTITAKPQAAAFHAWLQTPEALTLFSAAGFTRPAASAAQSGDAAH